MTNAERKQWRERLKDQGEWTEDVQTRLREQIAENNELKIQNATLREAAQQACMALLHLTGPNIGEAKA